jgi:hypothetical protein
VKKTSARRSKRIASTLRRYVYLSRGTYVNLLHRWSRLFGDEQVLVLKSEDFFERDEP